MRDDGAERGEQQRAPVGLRVHHGAHADAPVGADAIVDDDGLVQLLAQFVGQHADEPVARAACRERINDAHRLALRERRRAHEQDGAGGQRRPS